MCGSEKSANSNHDEQKLMDANKLTAGLHHLGLSVRDVSETADFFVENLNFDLVAEKPDYPAKFISDGTIMLTLWQVKDPATAVPFSRHDNLGLHHFALKLANSDALDDLHFRLQKVKGVEFEFAPEPLGDTPIRHMMCTIPGGLRVEFIALP